VLLRFGRALGCVSAGACARYASSEVIGGGRAGRSASCRWNGSRVRVAAAGAGEATLGSGVRATTRGGKRTARCCYGRGSEAGD
jgi:hypothetical protein